MYPMPDKDEAPWLDCMDGFELLGEANLDLINQKDALTVTREFMARKALDDLYRNNAEGMKRLADS